MNPLGIVAYILWAIVGLFFWIAVLFRAVIVYSFAIFGAILSGRDTTGLSTVLDVATGFYARGFDQITRSFDSGSSRDEGKELEVDAIALESLYALMFWAAPIAFLFFTRTPDLHFALNVSNNHGSAMSYKLNGRNFTLSPSYLQKHLVKEFPVTITFDHSFAEGYQQKEYVLDPLATKGDEVSEVNWDRVPSYIFVNTGGGIEVRLKQ